MIFENKNATSAIKPNKPVRPPFSAIASNTNTAGPATTTPISSEAAAPALSPSGLEAAQLSAKEQLSLALNALRTNSQRLESKLDKIEDLSITPTSFFDTSKTLHTDDEEKGEEDGEAVAEQPIAVTAKKKNDSFFSDFLSKSDDLIAQTQLKMERLSRLETIAKPMAPAIPLTSSPTPPQPKPRPTATILGTSKPSPLPSPSSQNLIDLKQQEQEPQLKMPPTVDNGIAINASSANQVDLLFDISHDQAFTLSTEPIAQTNSYFDLIGLTSFDEQDSSKKGDDKNWVRYFCGQSKFSNKEFYKGVKI